MEMQICQCDTPTMVDRPIKIERDEDEQESCENSETEIACVSTVPIPADKNTGSYFFPSQAVVSPRTPTYTTVSRMAQKRKTIQALAQAALMSAEEPILFEETIWCDSSKILLIDRKTQQVIAREHLRKNNNSTTKSAIQTPVSSTHTAPVDATRSTPGETPRTGKSFSQRHKTGSTTSQPEGEASSSTSIAITPAHSTPSLPAYSTSIHTPASTTSISSAVATRTLTPRLTQNQPARSEATATPAAVSRPRTSLLNSLPSERIEPANTLPDKSLPKQTTYKPLAVAPSASIRPETNSKTAICLPNTSKTVSKTMDSTQAPANAVYVPREIHLGATELRLEDCINVKDICDKELTKWTAEDVAKFVRATDCSEYAHVFIDQEIDGKALTLLNQDFLIQWMKLKLGPAIKLNCHIINLKHSLNTQ